MRSPSTAARDSCGNRSKLTFKGNQTIAADRSIRLRGIFRDKTPALTSTRLAAGSYTLEVSYDGYTASKTLQIQ